ncbi:MAG: EamA family transporter [Stackebrandtia sp.]
MHPVAIALVAAAAVSHAVWNLHVKRASDGGAVLIWLSTVTSVVIYAPLTLVVVLLYPPEWSWTMALVSFGTSVLHVGYFLLLQRGYQQGDMSVVYPLARGTGPILSVTFAIILFGERPNIVGIIGGAAVVAGILIIGVSRPSGASKLSAGVGYGLATGVIIATYTVYDAWAVGPLAIMPLLYDWGNNVCRSVLLAPHALRRRDQIARVWRVHRTPVMTIAVLAPASYIFVLFAYGYAPVSLVAPARELSIVVGGVLAWLLLHERQALKRIFGAVVVLAGVVALTTGTTK